jgi:hypothetical protein
MSGDTEYNFRWIRAFAKKSEVRRIAVRFSFEDPETIVKSLSTVEKIDEDWIEFLETNGTLLCLHLQCQT